MDKKEILKDLCTLHYQQGFICGIYEDEYGREEYIAENIKDTLEIANKYKDFKYKYNEKEFDKTDNTHNSVLSESDFFNCNITEENYPKADLIIGSIRDDLITFLKQKLIGDDKMAIDFQIRNRWYLAVCA